MRRQQRFHYLADSPVFNVIAVVGEGDRLKTCRFFTGVATGMVPAGEQAVGREPVALVLLACVIQQVVRVENVAQPLSYCRVVAARTACVKQQIVAALFETAFHRLFALGGTLKRQAAVRLFADFWQYPDVYLVNQRPETEVVVKGVDLQLVLVVAGDRIRPGPHRHTREVAERLPFAGQNHRRHLAEQPR